MKRIRIIGLCLAVVSASSAIAVSSASALPEILFSFTKGNIANGGTFTSSSSTTGSLQTLGGSKITCTSVKDNGSFLTAHLGLALVLFEGCTTKVFGTNNCTTPGQPTGHVHLSNLVFHLGLAHLGTNTTIPAIIVLLPSAGVEVNCELANVKVSGNIISALQTTAGAQAPIGVPEKEVNLTYKETNGMQELTLILLPLGGGTLTNQHLTSTILSAEESALESTGTMKEFKNSAGELTEIELVEG